jgi:hypothetical protein
MREASEAAVTAAGQRERAGKMQADDATRRKRLSKFLDLARPRNVRDRVDG